MDYGLDFSPVNIGGVTTESDEILDALAEGRELKRPLVMRRPQGPPPIMRLGDDALPYPCPKKLCFEVDLSRPESEISAAFRMYTEAYRAHLAEKELALTGCEFEALALANRRDAATSLRDEMPRAIGLWLWDQVNLKDLSLTEAWAQICATYCDGKLGSLADALREKDYVKASALNAQTGKCIAAIEVLPMK